MSSTKCLGTRKAVEPGRTFTVGIRARSRADPSGNHRGRRRALQCLKVAGCKRGSGPAEGFVRARGFRKEDVDATHKAFARCTRLAETFGNHLHKADVSLGSGSRVWWSKGGSRPLPGVSMNSIVLPSSSRLLLWPRRPARPSPQHRLMRARAQRLVGSPHGARLSKAASIAPFAANPQGSNPVPGRCTTRIGRSATARAIVNDVVAATRRSVGSIGKRERRSFQDASAPVVCSLGLF